MLIHNLGNALENQITTNWQTTAWGADLKLYDLEGNHIPALSLEPDEMIYVTARLEVPSNADLGDTVSTPLTMCVSLDPEICQTIDISFTATGVTTGVHQRTVPGTTLSWDISADMPVGENLLEWSLADAGLIIPGWSWSTTGAVSYTHLTLPTKA